MSTDDDKLKKILLDAENSKKLVDAGAIPSAPIQQIQPLVDEVLEAPQDKFEPPDPLVEDNDRILEEKKKKTNSASNLALDNSASQNEIHDQFLTSASNTSTYKQNLSHVQKLVDVTVHQEKTASGYYDALAKITEKKDNHPLSAQTGYPNGLLGGGSFLIAEGLKSTDYKNKLDTAFDQTKKEARETIGLAKNAIESLEISRKQLLELKANNTIEGPNKTPFDESFFDRKINLIDRNDGSKGSNASIAEDIKRWEEIIKISEQTIEIIDKPIPIDTDNNTIALSLFEKGREIQNNRNIIQSNIETMVKAEKDLGLMPPLPTLNQNNTDTLSITGTSEPQNIKENVNPEGIKADSEKLAVSVALKTPSLDNAPSSSPNEEIYPRANTINPTITVSESKPSIQIEDSFEKSELEVALDALRIEMSARPDIQEKLKNQDSNNEITPLEKQSTDAGFERLLISELEKRGETDKNVADLLERNKGELGDKKKLIDEKTAQLTLSAASMPRPTPKISVEGEEVRKEKNEGKKSSDLSWNTWLSGQWPGEKIEELRALLEEGPEEQSHNNKNPNETVGEPLSAGVAALSSLEFIKPELANEEISLDDETKDTENTPFLEVALSKPTLDFNEDNAFSLETTAHWEEPKPFSPQFFGDKNIEPKEEDRKFDITGSSLQAQTNVTASLELQEPILQNISRNQESSFSDRLKQASQNPDQSKPFLAAEITRVDSEYRALSDNGKGISLNPQVQAYLKMNGIPDSPEAWTPMKKTQDERAPHLLELAPAPKAKVDLQNENGNSVNIEQSQRTTSPPHP